MTAKTARVTVVLSMIVDVEAWASEYGTDVTAAAVRTDLKENLVGSISQPGDLVPAWDGLVTSIEVK